LLDPVCITKLENIVVHENLEAFYYFIGKEEATERGGLEEHGNLLEGVFYVDVGVHQHSITDKHQNTGGCEFQLLKFFSQITYQNSNGSWYQKGCMFMMPKRLEVGYTYLDLCIKKCPKRPTHQDLATLAKISKSYARKVIIELENTGSQTDPKATNSEKRR
jgi:hypothetical protein